MLFASAFCTCVKHTDIDICMCLCIHAYRDLYTEINQCKCTYIPDYATLRRYSGPRRVVAVGVRVVGGS